MVAVWCKLCSKLIEKIKADNTLKGKPKEDALNYTKRVTFVKKGNIDRHLAIAGHKIALSNESISTNKNVYGNAPKRGQISIKTSLKEPTKLAYKLFEAAYNLGEGMPPFNKFKVLVKCLRDNKVKLISGRDDHHACEEYVSYFAQNIRDKLAIILLSCKAFSILTDDSETRKTGLEKELIFICVIHGGILVYFCSALQDCNEFGSTDADSLKLAVDTAFNENNELVKLPENTYKYYVISSTADGASVN